MNTTNFSMLFSISILALILSLATLNYPLMIVTIVSMTIIAIGYFGLPGEVESIVIERDREEVHSYEGEEMEVGFTVKNESEEEVFLEIIDELSSNLELTEGSNHQLVHLGPKDKQKIKYSVKFLKTDNYKIGPVKARHIDTFELFSQDMIFKKYMNVVAMPPIEELSRTKLRPQHTRGWLGNIKSSQMGLGSEFFSIREYLQGDEMRDINWKATARYLTPKTNSYEAEKSGDVIIIVDAFHVSNVGVFKDNMLKHSVRAATSLASDILSDRNRVGLMVIGDFVRWVYPRSGEEQLYRIMDNLMSLDSGSMWRLEHANYILDNIFPNRCLLLFISPLTSEKVTDAIAGLARKKYDIAVLSPSPLDLQKRYLQGDEELAERLRTIERKNRMAHLRNYGPVIDWDPGQPLEVAIEGVRRYQMRK